MNPARTDLRESPQPQRGDISIVGGTKTDSSSVRSGICRPDGAWDLFGRKFYKDFAPDGARLEGRKRPPPTALLLAAPEGLKARQMIAQGKASLRATPWVNRPQNLQALKGRQKAWSHIDPPPMARG